MSIKTDAEPRIAYSDPKAVTSSEFTTDPSWSGYPVARSIAEARPRRRLIATGTVVDARTIALPDSRTYRCELDDGTGSIVLFFIGRSGVPGIARGTRCTVEGTIRRDGPDMLLWNPLYRLEP